MSLRTSFIHPKVKADPRRVAKNLRRIADVLDKADDARETDFYTGDLTDDNISMLAHAWAQTALIIADTCDVDSMTLRALALSIEPRSENARLF